MRGSSEARALGCWAAVAPSSDNQGTPGWQAKLAGRAPCQGEQAGGRGKGMVSGGSRVDGGPAAARSGGGAAAGGVGAEWGMRCDAGGGGARPPPGRGGGAPPRRAGVTVPGAWSPACIAPRQALCTRRSRRAAACHQAGFQPISTTVWPATRHVRRATGQQVPRDRKDSLSARGARRLHHHHLNSMRMIRLCCSPSSTAGRSGRHTRVWPRAAKERRARGAGARVGLSGGEDRRVQAGRAARARTFEARNWGVRGSPRGGSCQIVLLHRRTRVRARRAAAALAAAAARAGHRESWGRPRPRRGARGARPRSRGRAARARMRASNPPVPRRRRWRRRRRGRRARLELAGVSLLDGRLCAAHHPALPQPIEVDRVDTCRRRRRRRPWGGARGDEARA